MQQLDGDLACRDTHAARTPLCAPCSCLVAAAHASHTTVQKARQCGHKGPSLRPRCTHGWPKPHRWVANSAKAQPLTEDTCGHSGRAGAGRQCLTTPARHGLWWPLAARVSHGCAAGSAAECMRMHSSNTPATELASAIRMPNVTPACALSVAAGVAGSVCSPLGVSQDNETQVVSCTLYRSSLLKRGSQPGSGNSETFFTPGSRAPSYAIGSAQADATATVRRQLTCYWGCMHWGHALHPRG